MFGDPGEVKNIRWYKDRLYEAAMKYRRSLDHSDRIACQEFIWSCVGILTEEEVVDILGGTEREAENEQAQGQDSLQLEARR